MKRSEKHKTLVCVCDYNFILIEQRFVMLNFFFYNEIKNDLHVKAKLK